MATKIAIANQKGGVGKTTTALCIADAMEHCGYKTLLIDLDPQCNSTSNFNVDTSEIPTIYDVFNEARTIKEAILNTQYGDIIPGDKLLPTIESQINAKMDRYMVLKKKLKEVEEIYDFIVFDTPPNLGLYMLNALTAADGCICPVKAERFAIDGLSQLISTIGDAKENVNPNLKIYGVLLNDYNASKGLHRDTWNALPGVGEQLNFRVFSNPIRTCQDIAKAQALKTSLFEYSSKCNAAIDFANVLKELLENI